MNIIDELKWRGAVNQQTDEEDLYKLVGEKSISSIAASIQPVTACTSVI